MSWRDWLDRITHIKTEDADRGQRGRVKPPDPQIAEFQQRQREIRARIAAIQDRQRVIAAGGELRNATHR